MATKKSSTRKAAAPSDELRAVAERVLSSVPGATVKWKLYSASFEMGGKVFAFTRPGGMAMKLPEARVNGLADKGKGANLVMGPKTMREWAVVPTSDTALMPLVKEAAAFVDSLRKRKP